MKRSRDVLEGGSSSSNGGGEGGAASGAASTPAAPESAPSKRGGSGLWWENTNFDFKQEYANMDLCAICSTRGDLLCCDGNCRRSFHLKCINMTEADVPDEDWLCDDCKAGKHVEDASSAPKRMRIRYKLLSDVDRAALRSISFMRSVVDSAELFQQMGHYMLRPLYVLGVTAGEPVRSHTLAVLSSVVTAYTRQHKDLPARTHDQYCTTLLRFMHGLAGIGRMGIENELTIALRKATKAAMARAGSQHNPFFGFTAASSDRVTRRLLAAALDNARVAAFLNLSLGLSFQQILDMAAPFRQYKGPAECTSYLQFQEHARLACTIVLALTMQGELRLSASLVPAEAALILDPASIQAAIKSKDVAMLSELIVCSRILGSTHAEALDKGMAFLLSQQKEDGSFLNPPPEGSTPKVTNAFDVAQFVAVSTACSALVAQPNFRGFGPSIAGSYEQLQSTNREAVAPLQAAADTAQRDAAVGGGATGGVAGGGAGGGAGATTALDEHGGASSSEDEAVSSSNGGIKGAAPDAYSAVRAAWSSGSDARRAACGIPLLPGAALRLEVRKQYAGTGGGGLVVVPSDLLIDSSRIQPVSIEVTDLKSASQRLDCLLRWRRMVREASRRVEAKSSWLVCNTTTHSKQTKEAPTLPKVKATDPLPRFEAGAGVAVNDASARLFVPKGGAGSISSAAWGRGGSSSKRAAAGRRTRRGATSNGNASSSGDSSEEDAVGATRARTVRVTGPRTSELARELNARLQNRKALAEQLQMHEQESISAGKLGSALDFDKVDEYIAGVSPPDGAVHAYAHLRPQKLVQLSNKWGRPLSTRPMLGGVPVDLQRLFRAVLSKGGFDQMDKFRAWPQLIQRFKVPRQLPRAASKFRLLYRYRLHRLEKSLEAALRQNMAKSKAPAGAGGSSGARGTRGRRKKRK